VGLRQLAEPLNRRRERVSVPSRGLQNERWRPCPVQQRAARKAFTAACVSTWVEEVTQGVAKQVSGQNDYRDRCPRIDTTHQGA